MGRVSGLSRRRVLVGGLTVAALAASPRPAGAAPPDPSVPPTPPIGDQITDLERRNNAIIGVYAEDLTTGRFVAYRSDDMFAMCSTFKAYAAGRVLQMVSRGQFTLDHTEFVDPAAVVSNSPVTGERAGSDMTLAELCQAALQHSDNTAGNLLLKTLGGPPGLTAFARSVGDDRTRLDRWETELNSALPGDPRDTSTPAALAVGIRRLLVGDALGKRERAQLEEWMRGNQTSSMRTGLPPGWTSADKTGSGDYASTNDVGVVYGPDRQRLLLSVMTRTAGLDPQAPDLRPAIGDVAAAVMANLRP